MKHTTKPRYQFHAVKWTKKEKFEVKIEEKSWKDLNTKIHYPISSIYNKGFSMLGGKSRKCRYA